MWTFIEALLPDEDPNDPGDDGEDGDDTDAENHAATGLPRDATEILTLTGHSREVTSVAYSPDGRTIITGSRDGRAILGLTVEWDS